MPLHRIFIAVEILDRSVIEKLSRVIKDIVSTGADVKPVEEENLHITIRFIGEVEERIVAQVCEILKQIKHTPFQIHISGLGAFPNIEKPRVIWAGVLEGSRELTAIHDSVEKELRKIGIPPDREEFVPHLTLARVKSGRGLNTLVKFIKLAQNIDFGLVAVDKVVLKESFLTPRGPIYKNLCEVRLG
ncbi:RNA 2',3'-cyclic phosphodiesterase [Thermogladius sp. 4427co]|uniref:RNA 2',3'-cyclic phosphodiesterase n=1 Tax=Thermogladius sp. 4427co TaxID=3450718 RepID=UPI003F7A00F4